MWALTCSHFSHSVGADLEKLIVVNTTIKTLAVNLTAEDVVCVARALSCNSTITKLQLSSMQNMPRHRIGNKGLRILCEGLKRNNSVTTLYLDANDISDEGAKDLCSLLQVNHTINGVNLNNNNIVVLPEGFAFLTHVMRLALYDNDNIRFPPSRLFDEDDDLDEGDAWNLYLTQLRNFFAEFRYGRMRLQFLLGFHERVGNHSSIRYYFDGSTIFEPNLLGCIFEFLS